MRRSLDKNAGFLCRDGTSWGSAVGLAAGLHRTCSATKPTPPGGHPARSRPAQGASCGQTPDCPGQHHAPWPTPGTPTFQEPSHAQAPPSARHDKGPRTQHARGSPGGTTGVLPIPEAGLEPARPQSHRILNPTRLPFRHSGAGGRADIMQRRWGRQPKSALDLGRKKREKPLFFSPQRSFKGCRSRQGLGEDGKRRMSQKVVLSLASRTLALAAGGSGHLAAVAWPPCVSDPPPTSKPRTGFHVSHPHESRTTP